MISVELDMIQTAGIGALALLVGMVLTRRVACLQKFGLHALDYYCRILIRLYIVIIVVARTQYGHTRAGKDESMYQFFSMFHIACWF